MTPQGRKEKIAEAVAKVAGADIGAFCNIIETVEKKIMIVVENTGEEGNVAIRIQGDLTDDHISKIIPKVQEFGGDTLQLEIIAPVAKAPDIVESIFQSVLGTDNFDVEIELVVE